MSEDYTYLIVPKIEDGVDETSEWGLEGTDIDSFPNICKMANGTLLSVKLLLSTETNFASGEILIFNEMLATAGRSKLIEKLKSLITGKVRFFIHFGNRDLDTISADEIQPMLSNRYPAFKGSECFPYTGRNSSENFPWSKSIWAICDGLSNKTVTVDQVKEYLKNAWNMAEDKYYELDSIKASMPEYMELYIDVKAVNAGMPDIALNELLREVYGYPPVTIKLLNAVNGHLNADDDREITAGEFILYIQERAKRYTELLGLDPDKNPLV